MSNGMVDGSSSVTKKTTKKKKVVSAGTKKSGKSTSSVVGDASVSPIKDGAVPNKKVVKKKKRKTTVGDDHDSDETETTAASTTGKKKKVGTVKKIITSTTPAAATTAIKKKKKTVDITGKGNESDETETTAASAPTQTKKKKKVVGASASSSTVKKTTTKAAAKKVASSGKKVTTKKKLSSKVVIDDGDDGDSESSSDDESEEEEEEKVPAAKVLSKKKKTTVSAKTTTKTKKATASPETKSVKRKQPEEEEEEEETSDSENDSDSVSDDDEDSESDSEVDDELKVQTAHRSNKTSSVPAKKKISDNGDTSDKDSEEEGDSIDDDDEEEKESSDEENDDEPKRTAVTKKSGQSPSKGTKPSEALYSSDDEDEDEEENSDEEEDDDDEEEDGGEEDEAPKIDPIQEETSEEEESDEEEEEGEEEDDEGYDERKIGDGTVETKNGIHDRAKGKESNNQQRKRTSYEPVEEEMQIRTLKELLACCQVAKEEKWIQTMDITMIRKKIGLPPTMVKRDVFAMGAERRKNLQLLYVEFINDLQHEDESTILIPLIECTKDEPDGALILLQFIFFVDTMKLLDPDMGKIIVDFFARDMTIGSWCREVLRYPNDFHDVVLEFALAHLQKVSTSIIDANAKIEFAVTCILRANENPIEGLNELRRDLMGVANREGGIGCMTISRALYFHNSIETMLFGKNDENPMLDEQADVFEKALVACRESFPSDQLYLRAYDQLSPCCVRPTCFKRGPYACCDLANYCSQECRDLDWKRHKGNCENGKKIEISFDAKELPPRPEKPKKTPRMTSLSTIGEEDESDVPTSAAETEPPKVVSAALTHQDKLLDATPGMDYFIKQPWGYLGIQLETPLANEFRTLRSKVSSTPKSVVILDMFRILMKCCPYLQVQIIEQLEEEYSTNLDILRGKNDAEFQ